jgi:PAS domain S-box-containing protein
LASRRSGQADEAALRLAAIVDSSDDAIISKDINGVITNWNRAAENILGYSAQEIIGQPITRIIPAEKLEEESRILSRLRAGEKIEHFQTVRMKKNGERINVSLTICPIKDHHGNIVGAAKFLRDITQHQLAEKAAAHLAAIVESSEDAIISKDLTGIVTSWNVSAERILGYQSDEIVGRSILLIIPPELRHEEAQILAKLVAGERIEHFETVRMKKSGERLNVSLTISPVKDRDGQIVGAAKILRDITQQKKLEAALRTSERLASVGRMAATIAHEINNPLEAVTNFVYLASHHPDLPDNVKQYLNSADQELGRVAHIAQQTLGFYRDGARPALLTISEVLEDVLNIYERKFKYKQLRVEKRIEPRLTLSTLEGQLKQVLSNLLMNAVQASPDKGRIIVSARGWRDPKSGRRGARITIADDGSGIPAKDRDKIFSPFFTTKSELGTGLGLWISRELLEKSGGHIRFRSRDSRPSGTVMSIYVPWSPTEDNAELVA